MKAAVLKTARVHALVGSNPTLSAIFGKSGRAAPDATVIALMNRMAERVGFEPTRAFTLPVFKTGAVNRLATSPREE